MAKSGIMAVNTGSLLNLWKLMRKSAQEKRWFDLAAQFEQLLLSFAVTLSPAEREAFAMQFQSLLQVAVITDPSPPPSPSPVDPDTNTG